MQPPSMHIHLHGQHMFKRQYLRRKRADVLDRLLRAADDVADTEVHGIDVGEVEDYDLACDGPVGGFVLDFDAFDGCRLARWHGQDAVADLQTAGVDLAGDGERVGNATAEDVRDGEAEWEADCGFGGLVRFQRLNEGLRFVLLSGLAGGLGRHEQGNGWRLLALDGSLYHAADAGAGSTTFSPVKPAHGMNARFFPWKPAEVKKADICCLISVNRSSFQSMLSILLTATTTLCTPMLRTNKACSLVWPFSPASKLFVPASITRTAKSAWLAPAIMFGMKSRWPGASRIVNLVLSVSKWFMAISTVTPLSRSSDVESITQARAKDDLPRLVASLRYLSKERWSTTFKSYRSRPIRVLLP